MLVLAYITLGIVTPLASALMRLNISLLKWQIGLLQKKVGRD